MHAPSSPRPAAIAFAALALACALAWSPGFLHPVSLALATVGTAATLAAALLGRGRNGTQPTVGELRWTAAMLAAGIALGLVYGAVTRPGFFVPYDTLGALRPLLGAVAVLVASLLWRRAPGPIVRLRFPAVLALAAAMGALVIARSPRPHIDVWHLQQMGSAALLEGIDPYRIAYPNIYGPDTYVLSPAVLSPDRLHVLGNPYPPLTLLLGVPAVALGLDVRWVMLLAILFSAWAIRRLGGGALQAELAAVLLLVQPRTLLVLEESWTEPTVLATALLALLAVRRWLRDERAGPVRAWTWVAAGLAAGLALSSKQYAPMLLLPVLFATPDRGRWRAVALAVGTAAAIAAPFVVWDARAFFRSVVVFQIVQPFRPDALSWLAASVRLGGPLLPVWPAFVLAAATLAATIRRGMSLDRAIRVGAAAWLVLVLFNKQAFCNYYWLAIGLLCAAASVGASTARWAGASNMARREPVAVSARR